MIYGYIDPVLSVSKQKQEIEAFLKEKNSQVDKWITIHLYQKELFLRGLQDILPGLKQDDVFVFYHYPNVDDGTDFFNLMETCLKKGVRLFFVHNVFSLKINQKIKEISKVGQLIGSIEKKLLYFRIKK